MARPRKQKNALRTHVLIPEIMPVDWLTITMAIPRPSTQHKRPPSPFTQKRGKAGGFSYRQVQDLTKVWGRIDALHDSNGQEIGQVASNPRSTLLFDENQVQVKVDNRAFYDGRWGKFVDQLIDGEGWLYNATAQCDIAADGHGFLAPFDRYVKGEIEYSGKATLHFHMKPNKGVDSFRLGSRVSGKYARCYPKDDELAVSGKYYIADYWTANGVEKTEDMQRLEISMKGSEIRRHFNGAQSLFVDHETGEAITTARDHYEGMDERDVRFLRNLRDPAARATMFNSAAMKFVAFRQKIPGARARDKAPLLRWNFERIAPEVGIVERAPRLADIGANALKTTIKINYLSSLAGGGHMFLTTVQMYVAAFGLQGWYEERRPWWEREYARYIREGGVTAKTLFDRVRLTDGDL